ncbi:RecQ type DNA helicase Rqh1 [Schizosaccharomyces cryophilus OY26]|uniref:DNA 3'-5' helicase n=1 Tax=Schizosaccharomyces cryophilus (strain OY26 / ATCC MYA-4695 / CBS 11777 / NBRC 106824 / NRRL Y48691) TaxID=653667 RepID=S9W1X3_SCHCR|nr:RecQ type DNA helicase Rqh1 [Schizosaccharomyces cryophilus OY26]EPY54053.1 RecQ type DNA helicase Rqh1 [Schizosaccharomyces cryophilus OY26]
MVVTKTNLNQHLDWFFHNGPQKLETNKQPLSLLNFDTVSIGSSYKTTFEPLQSPVSPPKSNVLDVFDEQQAIDLTDDLPKSPILKRQSSFDESEIPKPKRMASSKTVDSEEEFDDVDEEFLRAAEMEAFQKQPSYASAFVEAPSVPEPGLKIQNQCDNQQHIGESFNEKGSFCTPEAQKSSNVQAPTPVRQPSISENQRSLTATPNSSSISLDFCSWPRDNLQHYLEILREEKSELSDRIIEMMENDPTSMRFKEWIPKRDVLSRKISLVQDAISSTEHSIQPSNLTTPSKEMENEANFSTFVPESVVKQKELSHDLSFNNNFANEKVAATPTVSNAPKNFVEQSYEKDISSTDIDSFEFNDADISFPMTDPIQDIPSSPNEVLLIDDDKNNYSNADQSAIPKEAQLEDVPLREIQNHRLNIDASQPESLDMDKSHLVQLPSKTDPALNHKWSPELLHVLKYTFNLRGFRNNQLDAINGTLSGKDVFVLMPTGGGKSLCYQLPAVVESGVTRGVTLVVSPLLSLMQDQLEHLKRINIPSLPLSGEQPAEERRKVISFLMAEKVMVKLLYVTPEGLASNGAVTRVLKNLYDRKLLARIVIDEAHCVSHWGHDFRPDYKQLGALRDAYRGVPLMALTATANEVVKKDIINTLRMDSCLELKSSFNRPNLFYEIRPKKDLYTELYRFLSNGHMHESGIIYCLSRTSCEQVADKLRKDYGLKAWHYHAGIDKNERQRIQSEWQAGNYKIIVATIAFGMGVDKGDVRFVIHHSFPKSLEGYYQETGRAGRDGKPAHCIMFYSYKDHVTFQRLIMSGDGDPETKERQRHMLRQVIQFCENKSDCRRKQILAYFGESFDQVHCCRGCDICCEEATYVKKDMTEIAAKAIKLIRSMSGKTTLLQLIDVFRGSKGAKIIENGWDRLEGAGDGKSLNRGDSERLFHQLVAEGIFVEKVEANRRGFVSAYVFPGKQTLLNSVIAGKHRVVLEIKQESSNSGNEGRALTRSKTLPNVTDYYSSLRRTNSSTSNHDHFQGNDDIYDSQLVPNNVGREVVTGCKISTDSMPTNKFMSEYEMDIVNRCFAELKVRRSNLMALNDSRVGSYFTDAMLSSMAQKLPRNVTELKEIHGVSGERAERVGPQFLQVIQKYIDEKDQNLAGTELDPTVESIDVDEFDNIDVLDFEPEGGDNDFEENAGSDYQPSSPLDEESVTQKRDILNFMCSQSFSQHEPRPTIQSTVTSDTNSYRKAGSRGGRSARGGRGRRTMPQRRKRSTNTQPRPRKPANSSSSFIRPMVRQNYN